MATERIANRRMVVGKNRCIVIDAELMSRY
jgi:hypothetical protein